MPTQLKENPVYGASRLGVFYRQNAGDDATKYVYQLTDHLGNVRAVVKKQNSNTLEVGGATDYYPGGMTMPNRNIADANGYRYGYQGEFAETDPETGKPAFQLRLYDPRINRWLTTDPANQYASPYMGMGNNPIITFDRDGAIGDTDYVDKEGILILRTDDGSKDIITIPDEMLVDFKFYAESYQREGMKNVYDDPSWNDNMKATIMDFPTITSMNNYLANSSSQWSRQKLIEFRQDPTTSNWLAFLGAEVIVQNLNPLNHMPTPIKVKASPHVSLDVNIKTRVPIKENPWHLFNREMGQGKFTKEIYGTSEAATRARRESYNNWRLENGY